jgi:AmiR/NasT family two-component response regulator
MRIRKSTGEVARASSRETFSVVIASQPGGQRLIAYQPRIAVARHRNTRPVRLRVLIADENEQRPDETAAIIGSLAHEVVSRLTDVSDVARPPKGERPDVAWRVSARTGACPRLVSEIVRQAACPVIADLDGDDPRFVEHAARRGISVRSGTADEMRGAIDIAPRGYAECSRAQGALSRRALIEQAKGIVVERHGWAATRDSDASRSVARSARSLRRCAQRPRLTARSTRWRRQ